MKNKAICMVCGRMTENPWLDLWKHFKPYQAGGFRFLHGNMQMSGAFGGFMSCVYLSSPLINTLRFWKYRKSTLDFGPDPMVLHRLKLEGDKIEAAKNQKRS